MKVLCSSCKKEIEDNVNFCPHCGQKPDLTPKALSTARKTRIYLASFFLSPLGLIWFFKYFRDDILENRKTAYIALAITLTPLLFVLLVGGKYVSSMSNFSELYKTNMNIYSELGL